MERRQGNKSKAFNPRENDIPPNERFQPIPSRESDNSSPLSSMRFDDSVVRIDVTSSDYDFLVPYNAATTRDSSGSGFVINGPEGRVVLTNAHVVANAETICISLSDYPAPFDAEVIVIGHDCDIALLRVKDPKFQQITKPLKLGPLAKINEPVTAVGFPIGGNTICYTDGTISRTEQIPYAHSGLNLLVSQLGATINPGSSGGPVMSEDGEVVGIAFQGMVEEHASPVDYMIPMDIMLHFLKDVDYAKGKQKDYKGFPGLLLSLDSLLNPNLRLRYQIPEDVEGMVVTKIPPFSVANGLLQVGDTIVSIDGFKITSDGKVTLGPHFRLPFEHLVHMKHIGQNIRLGIVRKGQALAPIDIKLTLSLTDFPIVPTMVYETPPQYVFANGICFSVLSGPLMKDIHESHIPFDPAFHALTNNVKTNASDQGVVMTHILPHPSNHHYKNGMFSFPLVSMVNGKPVKNLADVIRYAQENQENYFTVSFATLGNDMVIKKISPKEQADLLAKYQIRNDRSIHYQAQQTPQLLPTEPSRPPKAPVVPMYDAVHARDIMMRQAMQKQSTSQAVDPRLIQAVPPQRFLAEPDIRGESRGDKSARTDRRDRFERKEHPGELRRSRSMEPHRSEDLDPKSSKQHRYEHHDDKDNERDRVRNKDRIRNRERDLDKERIEEERPKKGVRFKHRA